MKLGAGLRWAHTANSPHSAKLLHMGITKELIDHILNELSEYDPFVHKESRYGDSAYIHFDNLPQGMTHKLRISDHEERAKYAYKWQLRLDGIPPKDEHKQYSRYFDDPDKLIKAFQTYYDRVARGDTSYGKDRNNTWA